VACIPGAVELRPVAAAALHYHPTFVVSGVGADPQDGGRL